MTTTVKDVIKAELFRVCLETTNKFRTKHEKKEKKEKYTAEEVEKVRATYKAIGWSEDQVNKQMEALAILHDAPELKKPTIPAMDTFCVVVAEKDVSGHSLLNRPTIWTKKRDAHCHWVLDSDGNTENHYMAYAPDAIRFATDEEVKICIDGLNEKQWRKLIASDAFKPIMDTAMAKAVQCEDIPVEEEDKDNGEITVYGRSLNVAE